MFFEIETFHRNLPAIVNSICKSLNLYMMPAILSLLDDVNKVGFILPVAKHDALSLFFNQGSISGTLKDVHHVHK